MKYFHSVPHGCFLMILLILTNPEVPTVSGALIDILNSVLVFVQDLLSPTWLFTEDKDESALPDVIIEHNGYPVEVHEVETEDGHILPLYRIPHSIGQVSRKGPVLVMPAWQLSASSYFYVSAEKALPFVLSQAGHDVWLGNHRAGEGTRHKNLTKSDFQYWNFSIDEMVHYDVPAVIDYVLNTTKYPTLDYVAFSLGGFMVIATLASRPEYNDKIRKVAVLGTTCYSVSNSFAFSTPPGFVTVLLRYFKHFSPSSARTLEQLSSFERTNRFQMYDFGKEGNLKRYGTTQPALYPLQNVTAQCMLVYSAGDKLVKAENTARTLAELGNSKSFLYEVKRKDFTHIDHILDDEVKPLVYLEVVEFFNRI